MLLSFCLGKYIADAFIAEIQMLFYGLNDAIRQFYLSVMEALLKLTCTQATLDPAIFFYDQNKKLCGILACHVDDFLHACNSQFEDNIMALFRSRFLAGKLGKTIFKYIGFNIHQPLEEILFDWQDYINSLGIPIIESRCMSKKLDALTSSENTIYRRDVGQLNWTVQCPLSTLI